MGQGTSQAVAKVEETRARLDAEVAELQRRLPPMVDKAKKRAAGGAGAVAGAIALVLGLRLALKRRRQRKSGKAGKLLHSLPDAMEKMAEKIASETSARL